MPLNLSNCTQTQNKYYTCPRSEVTEILMSQPEDESITYHFQEKTSNERGKVPQKNLFQRANFMAI